MRSLRIPMVLASAALFFVVPLGCGEAEHTGPVVDPVVAKEQGQAREDYTKVEKQQSAKNANRAASGRGTDPRG